MKQLFLFPGLLVPLLGAAYSRACESICDRYGAYAANDIDSSIRAMMTFSGGKEYGKRLDPERYAEQYQNERGFFISWHELISGYPTLSQRVANLLSLKHGSPYKKAKRNLLAHFFAIFSFGGRAGGGGNMIVTIAGASRTTIESVLKEAKEQQMQQLQQQGRLQE